MARRPEPRPARDGARDVSGLVVDLDPRRKARGQQRPDEPDRDEHGEQAGRHCAAAGPAGLPGQCGAERAERTGGGTDGVVDAVHAGGTGVLGGEHHLLQRGRRTVIHHVGRQRSGQRHQQQHPVRGAGRDHRPGSRDRQEKPAVAAPPADPIREHSDHQGGEGDAGDVRSQHDTSAQVAVATSGQQGSEQHGGEAVPCGPDGLPGDQQGRIPTQRPTRHGPASHRLTARPGTNWRSAGRADAHVARTRWRSPDASRAGRRGVAGVGLAVGEDRELMAAVGAQSAEALAGQADV